MRSSYWFRFVIRGFLHGKQPEVWLRFGQHPRERRSRHQPVEIGLQGFLRPAEGQDGVGVEKRRRR
jgi:hypothetical protein